MTDNAKQLTKEATKVTIQATMAIAKFLQDYIKNFIQEHNDNKQYFKSFANFITYEKPPVNKCKLNKNTSKLNKNTSKSMDEEIEDLVNNILETKNKNNDKETKDNDNEKKDKEQIEEQIRKQIDLKVEYLNTILKKYEKLGFKNGEQKVEPEVTKIKIPFRLSVENKMKKFINSEKMYEPQTQQQILEKQIKSVNNKITSAEILAKNLKKLNIRKKKDYSSFNETPKNYDPVGVQNEVNQKLYEKLEKIKDNQSFGKSRRKNTFGLPSQDIKKIRAESSYELVDIINEKLGENLVGKLFKPKIEEDEIRNLIAAIPNVPLQNKMTRKLESKLKNTQPTSLGDLNRKINRDTKELTDNTNRIYGKVKNLVDRINKKDKKILQLKNELKSERSISGTREGFNTKRVQDLKKKLDTAESQTVYERNRRNRDMYIMGKNIANRKNKELENERKKLVNAEKKAKDDVNYQVNQALRVRKEFVKYMNSKKIEYDKNIEKVKQNSSEAIKRLEDTCAKQISELKKEHKRFENRVVRVFNDRASKVEAEAKEKISRIQEEYKNSKGKDEQQKKVLREKLRTTGDRLNNLKEQETQALKRGIDRRNQQIEELKKDTQKRIKEQEEKLQRQQNQFKQNLEEAGKEIQTKIKSALHMSGTERKKQEEAARKKKEEEEAERRKQEEAERKKKEEAERKKKEEAERKKQEEADDTTFEDFALTKKIDGEQKEKFKNFHIERITKLLQKSSNFGSSDLGDIEKTLIFNSKRELLESWRLFKIKQAGNFINKNSKKIAAVATAAGALIAGVKSVKKKSSSSKKKKKSKIKPFASKKAKALADKNNLSGKDFPEMEKVGVKDVREKINS